MSLLSIQSGHQRPLRGCDVRGGLANRYRNYLRFETTGHAEYWATIIGDQGRRYKKIVLDMSDVDLSREQRRLAIDILFSPHDW